MSRWATFDCYGTLIDWELGLRTTFERLWPHADSTALVARHHEVEPRVQEGSSAPYRQVLVEALRGVADADGLVLPDEHADALVVSLRDWPPFPEVPDALEELRRRGWNLAILSNTDPELLRSSIDRIGVTIDMAVTVEQARSYKPAPGHWRHFFSETGADRAGHVHVGASLFNDIEPAHGMGLRAVWINRSGTSTDLQVAAELPDLRRLPDVLDGLVERG